MCPPFFIGASLEQGLGGKQKTAPLRGTLGAGVPAHPLEIYAEGSSAAASSPLLQVEPCLAERSEHGEPQGRLFLSRGTSCPGDSLRAERSGTAHREAVVKGGSGG